MEVNSKKGKIVFFILGTISKGTCSMVSQVLSEHKTVSGNKLGALGSYINSFCTQESHLLPGDISTGWLAHTEVLGDTLILDIHH